MDSIRPVRLVIDGNRPPPIGGQNLMIERILKIFREDERFLIEHLPLGFTKDWRQARKEAGRRLREILYRVDYPG